MQLVLSFYLAAFQFVVMVNVMQITNMLLKSVYTIVWDNVTLKLE